MSKELPRLRGVRRAYKGHVTQDINKAERLMSTEDDESEELTAIFERISRRENEITALDSSIVNLLESEDEIARDVEETLTLQDKVSVIKTRITKYIQNKNPPVRSNQHASHAPSTSKKHVNLPKMTIKTFHGDPLEWQTFWDSFSATIHENDELSNIQKMSYLNGILKDEAARAIAGLPMTSDNYIKATELLKERFGQKQVLINAHMEALINIPSPTNNTTNLREFYDTCESNIRGLEALDVKTDSYGNLLIPILLKKIPEELTRLIFRANPSADKCLTELRTELRKEIETRERSHTAATSGRALSQDEVLVPTTGTFLTTTDQGACKVNYQTKGKHCVYCNGSHRPEKCDKLKTVEERLAFLQQHKRCFNCAGFKHSSNRCKSKGRCLKCQRKHHTSICKDGEQHTAELKQDKSTQEGDHKPVHSGTTYAVLAKDQILMQSAIVRLKGNTAQLTIRAMFDTGSQRTFITKNLKEKLELKSTRKENINLTTFGSSSSVKKSLDVVTIHVLTDKQQIQLNALVTQTICPPFPVTIGRVQLPSELQGLHLADPLNSKNDLNVDILIRNDNFAKLITGNMKKSEDDCLIATESKMGWLISGPISKEFESDHTNPMLSLEIHQDEGEN